MLNSPVRQARSALKRLYYHTPLQRTVVRLAAPLRPPPWATPTMEFDYGVWLGPSSLHCVDGRQLGEENTWPRFFREFVPTEYRDSNMPGSRSGCSINMTALHMVMRAWNDALPLMGALRASFAEVYGFGARPLGMEAFFVLSKAGCALPAFLVRRHDAPLADGDIPALVATQFKLIAGFFMVAQDMLWGKTPADPDPDANAFFDYADAHGIFISPGGRACGGSRRKIIELYEYLHSAAHEQPLAPLANLADPMALQAYTAHSVALELVLTVISRRLTARYLEVASDWTTTQRRHAPAGMLRSRSSDDTSARVRHLRDNAGVWRVLDLLGTAAVEPLVSTATSRGLVEEVEAGAEQVDSPASVQQHLEQAAAVITPYAEGCQRIILDQLGRRDVVRLSPRQVRQRLNVLPLSLPEVK